MSSRSDTVRTRFVVEGGADITKALSEQSNLVAALEQKYNAADASVTKLNNTISFLSGLGAKVNESLNGAFIEANKNLQATGTQLIKARQELEKLISTSDRLREKEFVPQIPTRGQAPLAGGFNEAVRTRDEGTDSLLGRFNRAAEGMGKLKTQTDQAAFSMNKLQGVSLLTTSLLTRLGVPAAESISVLSNQFLEANLTLDRLLQSKTLGFAALTASVIASAQIIKGIVDDIRAGAELTLRTQQRAAAITFVGRQGGQSQVEQDLRKLEQAKKDIQFFLDRGDVRRATEISRTEFGGGVSEQELQRLQVKLEETIRKQRSAVGRFFLGGTSEDDVRAAAEEFTKALGGQSGPNILDQKLQEARRTFSEMQLDLEGRGDETNVFSRTFDSLRALARETGKLNELRAFVDSLRNAAKQGALGFDELTNATRDFRRGLEAVEDQQKRLSVLNERLNEQFSQANKLLDAQSKFRQELASLNRAGADDPVERLRAADRAKREQLTRDFSILGSGALKQLNEAADKSLAESIDKTTRDLNLKFQSALNQLGRGENPIIGFINEGQVRVNQFEKDFAALGPKTVNALKDASDRLRDSEIFKFDLTDRLGVTKLQTELRKLESFNLFGNTRQIEEQERLNVVRARIREAQQNGDFAAQRQAQSELFGIGSGLRNQIQDALRAGEFVKAAELENRLGQFERSEAEFRFNQSARQDELTLLSQKSLLAKTPEELRFVLDKILDITGNLGELTSEERDTRFKALQQRLALGESERHRVLIKIQNDSSLATTRVEQILGPEPTPAGDEFDFQPPALGGFTFGGGR
jgi:hypothetical protein